MTQKKSLKAAFFAALSALIAVLVVSAPPAGPWLSGLSIDGLFWSRAVLGLEAEAPEQSVAIIAIDEESYRRAPLQETPRVAWTPYLGRIIEAVDAAGAVAIGQDLILSTSLEPIAPGLDRPYFAALAKAGAGGKLVLGAALHQGKPLQPHRRHLLVAGGAKNLRLLNLPTDPDGIARRAPLSFPDIEGREIPGFAAELALRSGRIDRLPEAGLIPNFQASTGAPIYSFADILACAEAGDTRFLENAFANKIVLIGAVLDIEDRVSTNARFLGKQDGALFAARCKHQVMDSIYSAGIARNAIPGVTVHAQVIQDLIAGPRLQMIAWGAELMLIGGAAVMIALTIQLATPTLSVITLGVVAGGVLAGGVMAFALGLILPVGQSVVGVLFAAGASYGIRLGILDQQKRRLRQSFSRYLSPAVVAELVDQDQLPKLGGERRDVTIWFSDLAGFTSMSEGMEPEQLVTDLNDYLTVVSDVITAHRGLIDKYIGDAVVAVFGAPLPDEDHAESALKAALACQKALAAFSRQRGGWPETRIGLHSGSALVGNVGSEQRLNYTVMGDAVNLAARLESLNKRYGSTLLISDDVITRAPGMADDFRRLERVQVVGRSQPTTVYSSVTPLSSSALAEFESARSEFEAGAFESAATRFAALSGTDPVAGKLAKIARGYADHPPTDWSGVTILDKK
ncbi:MAG: adenylate/guanylate cyclase domain-containing protein [Pseudomonadota bacterium]